jgi:hypothetical protein
LQGFFYICLLQVTFMTTRKKAPRKKTARQKTLPKKPRTPPRKINAHALIEALEQHVLGEKEMTATQVSAALALLKKTLPDVTASPRSTTTKKPAPRHEDALKELE